MLFQTDRATTGSVKSGPSDSAKSEDGLDLRCDLAMVPDMTSEVDGQEAMEKLLASLELSKFWGSFRAAGIDDLGTLSEISTEDLRSLGLGIGHVAKLKKALRTQCYHLQVDPEVRHFLTDAKLEQYCDIFARQGLVRLDVVLAMESQHIEKLGLVMGHALMLQNAIAKKSAEAQEVSTTLSTSSITDQPPSPLQEEVDDCSAMAELLQAASRGDLERIKEISSETDASLNIKDRSHISTPLHEAAKFGHLEVARYLVNEAEPPAKVNGTNSSGTTALHWAAGRGHLPVVEFLVLQAHADVNAVDEFRRTPLHYAADGGHGSVVEFLVLKAGADKKATCKYGSTPRDYAGKHPKIQRFLRISALSSRFAKRGGILAHVLRHTGGPC